MTNPHAPYFALVVLIETEAPKVAAELRARGEYGSKWPGRPDRNGDRT